MNLIAYVAFMLFLYPLAFLPLPVQYGISNVLFVILFYVMRYRRDIVQQNLRRAFPNKSDQELETIERQYYYYLCGLFAESFKSFSISKEELLRRLEMVNLEHVQKLYDQGKNITVLMGHTGNWEWAGLGASLAVKYNCYAIYHDLQQPYFDNFLNRSRSRFGLHLLSGFRVKEFYSIGKKGLFLNAFIADQTPSNPRTAYWTKFMGQDTPFFTGADKFARQMNTAVIYVDVHSTRRGHYHIEIIPICDDPDEMAPGEIIEKYVRLLEKSIERAPAQWLWSHKRWKHKMPDKLKRMGS